MCPSCSFCACATAATQLLEARDARTLLRLHRQLERLDLLLLDELGCVPFSKAGANCAVGKLNLRCPLIICYKRKIFMAAIGRFQKGDEIFFAKVVDGELFRLHGDVFGSPSFDKKPLSVKGIKTLTPVQPSKVIAVGLNYADHARESGKPLPKEPLFWLKAPTSLIPDGAKIEIPFPSHRTDFEAELAIVIGRRVRNVTPAAAARYIFGYTAAEDISDRTIQNSESQWARCKSFDTFTPLGPYVETKIDPHDLTIQLFQNGQLRQNSNTSQLIFNCYQIVSFVSTNMTLLPGDIILTGTPSGVGPIESGDRLEVRIQGLAPLVNTVK